MGADCKSAGYAYVGSNPTRPTTSLHSSAVEHSLGKGEVTSSILVEGFIQMGFSIVSKLAVVDSDTLIGLITEMVCPWYRASIDEV